MSAPDSRRLQLCYTLTAQQLAKGFWMVDRHTQLRRRIVLSAIAAVVCGIFIWDVVHTPGYYQGILLAILSGLLAGVLWLIPILAVRGNVNAVLRYSGAFTLTATDRVVTVMQGQALYQIDPKRIVCLLQAPGYLVFLYRNQMIFVIPTDQLAEQDIAWLIEQLQPPADGQARQQQEHV